MVASYDLVAIGAGPAGECATELAAYFGYRCLLVEKSAPGGTVTTTGGVPTKTLREAAMYFTGFRDRDVYGLGWDAPPELVVDRVHTIANMTLNTPTYSYAYKYAALDGLKRLRARQPGATKGDRHDQRETSAPDLQPSP